MQYYPRPEGWTSEGMYSYPVFTLYRDRVERGAEIAFITLESDGSKIPVIRVGERGRGRTEGILPIIGLPDNQRSVEYLGLAGDMPWKRPPLHSGIVTASVRANTKSRHLGYYALEASRDVCEEDEGAILVCRFALAASDRDQIEVTGDYEGQRLILPDENAARDEIDMIPAVLASYPQVPFYNDLQMPLASGVVAHGGVGTRGRSPQYILLQGKGCPLRVHLKRDLLGKDDIFFMPAHDNSVIRMTGAERTAAEERGTSPMPFRRRDRWMI